MTYDRSGYSESVADFINGIRQRSGENQERSPCDAPIGISHEDFYAYMIEHKYIFVPTGEIWPAASVNASLPDIDKIKASTWLDQNRRVQQMTWAPGVGVVVRDKLVSEGGWFDREGATVFNLYRPPMVKTVVGNADPWLAHVERLYGTECAGHIVRWCAHRVQRPAEKINHALVLGGKQGIGKDSLLEPVKHAIGAWNFVEVSPTAVLDSFNGHLKSVILRVSEARDLGEFDRFSFYDHMKSITAAPPDVLRVNEKYRHPYTIPNVCGVIITTNHKSDGIYLPADDRRHFVAWSDCDKEDFQPEYWSALWGWYDNQAGLDIVAHYLRGLDLTGFNPKEPPPKTGAFFEIVNASRSPEDAELSDSFDQIAEKSPSRNWPDAVTVGDVISATASQEFAEYLKDRRNSRKIPFRFEACGYVPVRNSDADDGLWSIRKKRQVIYARSAYTEVKRYSAATAYWMARR